MSGPAPLRVVEVRSPSSAAETGAVIRALLHLGLWSAVIVGLEVGAGVAGAPAIAPGYDEVGFASLPAADQRLFGLIREGVTIAEQDRSQTGAWPAVAALAARAVPPFAVDPLDRGGYRWQLVRDGRAVAYVGTPTDATRARFAIAITEPEPGTPIDPTAVVDEVHHRLGDGTPVHVLIWRAPPGAGSMTASPRAEDGWRRVTTRS